MDRARDGPAASAPHRVGRLRFELDGRDESVLIPLRGAIVGGAESWIPQALDRAFAAIDQPGRTLHIPRLEIDLGDLPAAGLTHELLSAALRTALAERLRPQASSLEPAPRLIDEAASLAGTLRYFLRHGRLPWWSLVESLAELELSIMQLDVDALRDLARAGAAILATLRGARRLVLQVAPSAAARLAAALPGARPGEFKPEDWPKPADREAVDALVARIRIAAASLSVRAARDGSDAKRERSEEVVEAVAAQEHPDDTGAEDAEALPEVAPGDAIAVADAGLVLLHPFLPALFEARGLAAAGRFAGEAEQQRAVHLTAWLAGGDTTAAEPELVMAKLLCGWPLDEPLPRDGDLAEADLAEAEDLLRAAIGHWEALGKASPAALRESFLMRPGRLFQDEEAWRLEVERRGADVLLGRLPWVIGTLRLPWMARPLFVDWA